MRLPRHIAIKETPLIDLPHIPYPTERMSAIIRPVNQRSGPTAKCKGRLMSAQ